MFLKNKNQKGNTIVSLLIAAGLMVTIIWAVMDLLNLGQKNQTSFVNSMSFQQMRLTSMMTLMNPKLCESVFTTGNHVLSLADPQNAIPTFNAIVLNGQQVVPEVNSKELKEVSLKIENPKPGPALPNGNQIYFADFSLTAQQNKSDGAAHTFQEVFPIQLIVDSSMKITGCYSNELECPASDTPPACASSTTPLVTFLKPTLETHYTSSSNVALEVNATQCKNETAAKAKIKIIFPGESTETVLTEISPSSTTPNTALFTYNLEFSVLKFGSNNIIVEVSCHNNTEVSCKQKSVYKQNPNECPHDGRHISQTDINEGMFKNFGHCENCSITSTEVNWCKNACSKGANSKWQDGSTGDCNGSATGLQNCPSCP